MKAFEKNIRKVEPYVPGEQPQRKVIKLNTNENPYPPAPGVTQAIQNLSVDRLRLYPDPTSKVLVDALAEYYGVGSDQVFVGVGSDDVLSMVFLTLFHSDKPVLFPDITYSFYDVWAKLYDIPYECIPLDEDFCIRKEDYYRPNGGIVIANPNAPTGVFMPLSEIEDILQHNPESVVVVDEAYVDFGADSALPLTKKYDNLLVVQTFSKSRSMAGARLGFAAADSQLIEDLDKIKYSTNPYNINRLTMAAGVAALKSDGYFMDNCRRIMETRAYTTSELEKLGFSVLPSASNFIFAKSDRIDGGRLYRELKSRGILIRHFDKERISDYNRITIGTREEMDAMLEKINEILEEDENESRRS